MFSALLACIMRYSAADQWRKPVTVKESCFYEAQVDNITDFCIGKQVVDSIKVGHLLKCVLVYETIL